jgi:hypothetical protein
MFGGGGTPAKTATPAKTGGGGGSGMFDGMTVKAGAPSKTAAPPAKQHPPNLQLPAKRGGVAAGQPPLGGPPRNQPPPAKQPPPSQPPVVVSTQPQASMDLGGGGGGMDLFSGMSLMPADNHVNEANGGGSLLSMLNGDGTSTEGQPSGDATGTGTDGSAFGFLSGDTPAEPTGTYLPLLSSCISLMRDNVVLYVY